MTVVDASIVVRLLQNRRDDDGLRAHFAQVRYVHAPALIDAEVASAIRGMTLTSKTTVKIGLARAEQMLEDFAALPLTRYPMQPLQRRTLMLRHNFTAYDAFYVALAEGLNMPLLTDDRKYQKAGGHKAEIDTWPPAA